MPVTGPLDYLSSFLAPSFQHPYVVSLGPPVVVRFYEKRSRSRSIRATSLSSGE